MMRDGVEVFFWETLRGSIKPATGCTEPCAIALCAATARKHADGAFIRLTLKLDGYLYKNACCVGIPGTDARGVAMCAAMGLCAGDPDAGINVLHSAEPAQADMARQLVQDGAIIVEVCPDCERLFIQCVLETDTGDQVRVTTLDRHDNIVEIVQAPFPGSELPVGRAAASPILAYSLQDMLDFVDSAAIEDLAFLQDGVDMNLAVADAGRDLDLGRAMRALLDRGALADCPITQAKLLTACAAYARMSGLPLPVMTATGSGNQGITVTMTVEGVARALKLPQETKLRGLALAHLVNLYASAHVGGLSALCACGVASGLGAAVAVVYLLGGTPRQMLLATQNMLGSICGMICDGAKEGCANKVELAAGLAVQSAYLATEDVGIPDGNGILSNEWERLFANMGALAQDGMRETNKVIVRIMQGE